ncbi:MAG: HIRAN domain-containing protein [Candidatus Poribacteria bacterium]|nr:HIRAN domain-containing protein [Candidatus Poribacteria bacterium]
MDSNGVLDAVIERYNEFGSVVVSPGENVFLYRRLADAHDKGLVAIINEMNDVIGYLNREVAEEVVIPALKEGVRFQCTVSGEPQGDTVPIIVQQIAQSEVTAILARRGMRRGSDGAPPLAGVFDDNTLMADEDDEDEDDIDFEEDFDDEDDSETEEEGDAAAPADDAVQEDEDD